MMDRKLTLEELEYVQEEVKLKGKKTIVAYLLAIFFGPIGLHMAYLEKRKKAVIRVLLTIIIGIVLFMMGSVIFELETTEVTTQLQQYSSILSVIVIGTLTAQFYLLISDLISMPRMVRVINGEIEEDATTKIIQSEYAESVLRENLMSDNVIERVIQKVIPEIEDNIKESTERVQTMNSKLKDREVEINSLSSKLSSDIDKTSKMADTLSEDVEDIQRYIMREITEVKAKVRDAIHNRLEDSNGELRQDESEQLEVVDEASPNPQDDVSVIKENTEGEESGSGNSESEANSVEKDASIDNDELVGDNVIDVESALDYSDGLLTLTGYIVGAIDNNGVTLEEDFNLNSNILIADSPHEVDIDKMMIIQLSKGSGLRGELGLRKNPSLLKTKIVLEGERFIYFNKSGLKNVKVVNPSNL